MITSIRSFKHGPFFFGGGGGGGDISRYSTVIARSNNYKSYIKKFVTPQEDDSFHSASIHPPSLAIKYKF